MTERPPQPRPTITVWQPYASLIMHGIKTFETRPSEPDDRRVLGLHLRAHVRPSVPRPPQGVTPMATAADVREALARRWPDGEYIRVEEAPMDQARQGRKIDVLVFGLWRSRGLQRDAVEIKVSMSDLRRELNNPSKADWWWEHTHRFWIAAPDDLAKKAAHLIPAPWGLLAVSPDRTRVIREAPTHKPSPLPYATFLGIMREIDGAGANALRRARADERAKTTAEIEAKYAHINHADVAEIERLRELAETVAIFEQASGIQIARGFGIRRIGEAARLVNGIGSPDRVADALHRHAANLTALADALADSLDNPT